MSASEEIEKEVEDTQLVDQSPIDLVKLVVSRLTTSKTSERIAWLTKLTSFVAAKHGDINDKIAAGLAMTLMDTLHRYPDRPSRLAVRNLIASLTDNYTEVIVAKFVPALAKCAQSLADGSHSGSQASSLDALGWVIAVMVHGFAAIKSSPSLSVLIKAQALLLAVLSEGTAAIKVSAQGNVESLLKKLPELIPLYLPALLKGDAAAWQAASIGVFVTYCNTTGKKDVVAANKAILMDNYIKVLTTVKVPFTASQLVGYGSVVALLDKEEFKTKIVPVNERMNMRSINAAVEVIAYQMLSLPFDASDFLPSLTKTLLGALLTKDDETRAKTPVLASNIARAFQKQSLVGGVNKALIDLLNGKGGKIANWEHRLIVLDCLSSVAQCITLTSQSDDVKVTSEVVDALVAYGKKEANENVQVAIVDTIGHWSRHLATMPACLLDACMAGIKMDAKAPIRRAYLGVLAAGLTVEAIGQCIAMVKPLTAIVIRGEKAQAQVVNVIEAMVAACTLVRWAALDATIGVALKDESELWSVIFTKTLFVTERFLTTCSVNDFAIFSLMMSYLMTYYTDKTIGSESQWNDIIIYLASHSDYSVRQPASDHISKALMTIGSNQISTCLLNSLANKMLQENSPDVSAVLLGQAATLLCIVPTTTNEGDKVVIALRAITIFHHPKIASQHGYEVLLKRLGLDVEVFLKDQSSTIVNIISGVNGMASKDAQDRETALNVISTVIQSVPETLLQPIIDYAMEQFDHNLANEVKEYEYGVYRTPKGTLFDDDLLANIKRQDRAASNVKRTSKLYSADEEKWEAALRREQAIKKGENPDVVKLTKHQLETIEKQLAKEQVVREKVAVIDNQLSAAIDVFGAIIRTNPAGLEEYVPMILEILVPMFGNPLMGRSAMDLWCDVSAILSPNRFARLALPVAYATFRTDKAYSSHINSDWLGEPINQLVARVIERLESMSSVIPLPAASFAYSFRLVEMVLRNQHHTQIGEQKKSMALIKRHLVQLGGEGDYPRKATLDLLCYVASHYDNLQKEATNGLIALCDSAKVLSNQELSVLFSAYRCPVVALRRAIIEALHKLDLEHTNDVLAAIWLACYDEDEDNQALASDLWDDKEFELQADQCMMLANMCEDIDLSVQSAASRALASALSVHDSQLKTVVDHLLARHFTLHQIPDIKLDEYGRPIIERYEDPWEKRLGLATGLKAMAENFSGSELMTVMNFFIECGFADRNADVRAEMLDAAMAIIAAHGLENVAILLNVFEDYLDTPAPASEVHDHIRQSVVIAIGSLARHLDRADPKIPPIISKLVAALKTPSQQVQEAVSKCLPPLIPAVKADAAVLCEQLMNQLLEGVTYAERKGAAYGLAGVVKGLGILSLKQHNIVTTLQEAMESKDKPKHREGSLMAFETLVVTLGRLFEPYVIRILPSLLICFGDPNNDVREAADDASKAIVKHLSNSRASGPGVKLVLPHLLGALDDKQWRTKQGAVQMLGAMSYCAPDQLSSCLPQIVPRLTEVLTDSHTKVQNAARKALTLIGSVIKNPEIQAIVGVLLDALSDPNHKTQTCLTTLLDTNFVHFIDAASLALIMPALQRALKERETDTKMMAAQIIGNMSALTNQKDLAPYLVHILPGLKKVLVDPNPDVREISAKALGTMVRGMGEENFSDLIPWLIDTLKTDNNAVDRSGAAQGLSEVLYGLGVDKLEGLIPDIVANTNARHAHIREGFLMVFVFLPASFGEELTPYIPHILAPILRGLADESESVRDAALRAGQMIVNNYSETSVDIFLPALEKGLFDDSWRIRQSSVHLLGDLLFRISGQSGKKSTASAHDDDNFGTEESRHAIMKVLGEERSHRVFAGLFMARSDVSLLVRQAALHIWKVVVFNTVRTIREVMPVLMELLLSCLASQTYDKRQIAARTLGDMVKKLGDRVLPEIIPILEQGLESSDAHRRCGVCVGLSEIMSSTNKEQVLYYINTLLPSVRTALCDSEPMVRETAAQTFNTLHTAVGYRAIDEILPSLLESLDDPASHEGALDGLRQIMAVKSSVVLPFLVPKLTAPPVTSKNVHALAALAGVSGQALNRHLGSILPALIEAINDGGEEAEAIQDSLVQILLATDNEQGVTLVLVDLLEKMGSDFSEIRCTAANVLALFCQRTTEDFTDHIPSLLQKILLMFNDISEDCVKAAWNAANAVTKVIKKEDQAQYISLVRRTFRMAAKDEMGQPVSELPGFCVTKGISPILPMFLHGLIYGSPEIRQIAAAGLGDIISLTSPVALKPFVIQITGPLIRVIADRFAWQIKATILKTLDGLIRKVGPQLKAFLPQLQTTFIKALSDPNKVVRDRAAVALGQLAAIHTRIDALLVDLANGVRSGEAPIRESMLHALLEVLPVAVEKMADKTKDPLEEVLLEAIEDSLMSIRHRAAKCLGLLGQCLDESRVNDIVHHTLLADSHGSEDVMEGKICAFVALLAPENAPEKIYPMDNQNVIVPFIVKAMLNENDDICINGVRAACHLLSYLGSVEGHTGDSIPEDLLAVIARVLATRDNTMKMLAAQALKQSAKLAPGVLCHKTSLGAVGGPLLAMVKSTYIPGRIAAERAFIYLLAIKRGDSLLMSYAKTLDQGSSVSMIDLGKRILPKRLGDVSDDDDATMANEDETDME